MKKYAPRIIAGIFALILVLDASGFLFTQNIAQAMGRPPGAGGAVAATAIIDVVNCVFSPLACALRNVVIWIMEGILGLASLIVGLAGVILNGIIYYTIVDVAQNYERITAINSTWTAVRDLSNMVFIFLLLYAAISTIIGRGEDTKKLIVNIIIVAILINFSLFFTKIVIDAANVLALFFYSAINPGLISPGFSLTGGTGLSDSFMQHLNLTSLYRPGDTLSMSTIFTIGIMGTIMLMVAAFVFFSVAIMFLVRYVVLILVLILSPLAFLSWVFPAMREAGTKWLNALVGQAFFAPIYLMITWIALRVLGDVGAAFGTTTGGRTALSGLTSGSTSIDPGVFATFVNFLVVIIFLLASLAIAKSWANRAGAGVTKLNKWATGAAGGAAFGGAAWIGRQSIGRAGIYASQRADLQTAAKDKTGMGGAMARLGLYAANKARSGSYDVRSAVVPTSVAGDLVRGTVGRTKIGKKLGLDYASTKSIQAMAPLAGFAEVGEGGKKGMKDYRDENRKMIDAERAGASREQALAVAREAVNEGAKSGATPAQIDAMERALSNLNDKQTEALVTENRALLNSQNFANAISVKQLETLNKSEQLSEAEKNDLKDNRFRTINTAMATGGAGAITAVRNNIRGLSDTELEMINPTYLRDDNFVGQLRTSQIETINKSNKFTTNQKNDLRTSRRRPLMNALTAGNIAGAKTAIHELGHKELASLNLPILINPTMLKTYTPQMLTRMVSELNPADIPTIRQEILRAGDRGTINWLNTPAGATFS